MFLPIWHNGLFSYLMWLDAIDADHVSHSTRIFLIAGVVQTLLHGKPIAIYFHAASSQQEAMRSKFD